MASIPLSILLLQIKATMRLWLCSFTMELMSILEIIVVREPPFLGKPTKFRPIDYLNPDWPGFFPFSNAIARTVGHLSKSVEVMKLVNNLIKAPEMVVTMQEFSKEMTKGQGEDLFMASFRLFDALLSGVKDANSLSKKECHVDDTNDAFIYLAF
ncbi:hypothetical protein RIF29_14619 [Crotalaria pallida]|uniref:Uncharacterized protein n=1 Tax=Crotalaria pallida TaxID=3830 RepID=A0AAN9IAG6_CROPI